MCQWGRVQLHVEELIGRGGGRGRQREARGAADKHGGLGRVNGSSIVWRCKGSGKGSVPEN